MSVKIHVKKGDMVIVLSGKDKGKRGRILKALPRQSKVLVDGINVVKRHTRPKPPKIPRGGILEKALPIHSSNVMLICSKCDKPTRISKIISKDKKVRVCKKCGEET